VSLLTSLADADQLAKSASGVWSIMEDSKSHESESQREAHRLGIDLLTKVAHIEESSFRELQSAISEEREGLVNGLIQEMNNSIARHLNISRWWSQDSEFQLRVSPREHELV